MDLHARLRLHPNVRNALAQNQPVVALESTIIAHGFPYPANLELAEELRDQVRAAGATPATIALIDGELWCGLDEPQLRRLASDDAFTKCAARDLPIALARRGSGATTVSATCTIAALAGIEVFATGGIGGVHRGAEDTYDESADLYALATQSVMVVSAGAKAILDLPRTVERLETLGVPLVGYRCTTFPAFYAQTSAVPVPHTVTTAAEIAEIWRWRRQTGGLLVANPIPAGDAIEPEVVDRWIAAALGKADEQGVTGKALTPFLLREIANASGGVAVAANRALALSNATLGAQIATALCAIAAAAKDSREAI